MNEINIEGVWELMQGKEPEIGQHIFVKFNPKCPYCDVDMKMGRGGSNGEERIVWVCKECNNSLTLISEQLDEEIVEGYFEK